MPNYEKLHVHAKLWKTAGKCQIMEKLHVSAKL